MKRIKIVTIVAVVLLSSIYVQAATKDAIVKIYTSAVIYDYDSPWQISGTIQSFGSGSIIPDKRILTNAHVVSNATYIEVQRNGDPRRFPAQIIEVSHDADLALLQVDNDSFFEGAKPLRFGTLPELLDEVVVYGFPEGGEGLSVTKGIISRIEVTQYVHSLLNLLGLQIDAAINSGNSGGPVVIDNKIIGVAMQTRTEAENIGYVIPVPVIEHFLTDLEDGNYDGFPDSGIVTQSLENKALRSLVDIPESETGVYVYEVIPGGSSDGYIKEGDVVMEVDNHPIANDGSVLLRPGLRVQYRFYFNQRQLGETAQVTIWRNREKKTVSIPLTLNCGYRKAIKNYQYDRFPEYYVLAGIIFTPLSINYLATWGDDWLSQAPPNLIKYFYGYKKTANEQVVIVNGLLASEMTTGYQDIADDQRVISINGSRFENFKEFVETVDIALAKDELITLELENNSIFVVSPTEHKKNEENLLKLYGLPSSRNVD